MNELRNQISKAINDQLHILAEKVVDQQYERQPEFWKAYGARGRALGVRDVTYHLPFLAEAILADDPSWFTNYVAWVKILFAGLNFPDSAMIVNLECMRDVLQETLPEEMAVITSRYLEAGIDQMWQGAPVTPSFIDEKMPLADLAQQYIDTLLRGERHTASILILDAVKNGTAIQDIYLQVFQQSQYEIGRLWMTNKISVAQEHFCSAATQFIMSQLYPYIFTTKRAGRRLVAACVGGELHEIGMRMVADFFEMEGWDTYYMGANTPTPTIVQVLKERQVDVLGISAAMTFHRSIVAELIDQVRQSEVGQQVKILVGGQLFRTKNDEWQRLGADGYAQDAQEALEVARRLMGI
jgi:methylmalonyl-CoA mutase cobalamin-binding domain/chain